MVLNKIVLALYLDFARESVKSFSLMLNISAGDIIHCREQQFARELRIEQVWCKGWQCHL